MITFDSSSINSSALNNAMLLKKNFSENNGYLHIIEYSTWCSNIPTQCIHIPNYMKKIIKLKLI